MILRQKTVQPIIDEAKAAGQRAEGAIMLVVGLLTAILLVQLATLMATVERDR